MRRALAGTIALAFAGCTLITGVGDLTSGGDDAGLDGATMFDGSVGMSSSGTDAASNDTGAPADATTPNDAAPDVVGPARAFCDGVTADFCFDFDSKTTTAFVPTQNGSSITVDSPGHDSGLGLHCVGNDDVAINCYYTVPFTTAPSKIHYRFDVELSETNDQAEFNEVEFNYQVGRCAIQPTYSSGTLQVNEYCPDQGVPDQVNHNIATVTTGAGWFTFVIDVDFTARTFGGSITKPDGAVVPFGPITLDTRFVSSKLGTLNAGLSFAPKRTPGGKLRTDNIALDLE